MRRLTTAFVVLLFLAGPARGEMPKFRFATVEEGQAELRKQDDYSARLSAFDRSARLKVAEEVSPARFADFIAGEVREWSPEERARLTACLETLRPPLEEFSNLPKVPEILLIHTTGREEGNAAYTRGRSIILSDEKLSHSDRIVTGLLAHEIFHILSRADEKWRDRMYAVIGFRKVPEVKLPADLAARRVTNPDAPIWQHAISVKVAGQPRDVVPIILAKVPQYPAGATEDFFAFLQLGFVALPLQEPFELIDATQLEGYTEQIGANTNYTIHPEEILADNFMHLLLGKQNLPTPRIPEEMRAILRE
jgi:hypothetical protein